jgi:nucleoside-diphosphate-sugar epimerase
MARRVLIAGCGYLGRVVAEKLRLRGDTVLATTRSRADELTAAGILPITCDILKPVTLTSLPKTDAVVYSVGFDRAAGHSMRDVYIRGLDNFLTHLPEGAKLVHISSTSVYGQRDREIVDETSPTLPVEEAGRIVLEAEGIVRRHRPNAIILRFAGIYGPGRLFRQRAIEAGEPIAADPDGWLNLIHVEDGATAVLAAIDHGGPGAIFNVSDGSPVRRRDFYSTLAAKLNAPEPRFIPSPESNNRRIASNRITGELGVVFRYPHLRDGIAAALAVKDC